MVVEYDLNNMCDHRSFEELPHLSRPFTDLDTSLERDAYEAHAPAIYGTLLNLMHCEDCASGVLAVSFLSVRAIGDAPPRLCDLLRVALAYAVSSTDESERPVLRDRIRTWFTESVAPNTARGIRHAGVEATRPTHITNLERAS